MPDLSADRPLPLPDESFTEEDVALVGDAIGSRAIARIALRVLAAAGRLLPERARRDADLYGTAFIWTDPTGARRVLKPTEVTVVLRQENAEEGQ